MLVDADPLGARRAFARATRMPRLRLAERSPGPFGNATLVNFVFFVPFVA